MGYLTADPEVRSSSLQGGKDEMQYLGLPRGRAGDKAPKEAQTQSRVGPVTAPSSRLIARQGIGKFRV